MSEQFKTADDLVNHIDALLDTLVIYLYKDESKKVIENLRKNLDYLLMNDPRYDEYLTKLNKFASKYGKTTVKSHSRKKQKRTLEVRFI